LVSRLVEAHNTIYQREIDEIGYLGKSFVPGTASTGDGLLNHADSPTSAAAQTATAATGEQLYTSLSTLITNQWADNGNTDGYMATRVAMPTSVYNIASTKILKTEAGPSTVLAALRANFPTVEFVSTFRGESIAFGGSVGTKSSTVAYNPSSDSMIMRIPQPLTVGDIVQPSSFHYRVDAMYRIAGLDLLETTSIRRLTGL
jgi:hypothetical protein